MSEKIVMGKMFSIENKNKKTGENEKYIAVYVEDESGNEETERCLLFTEIELSDMEKVVLPFVKNTMKKGRIYSVIIDKKETNLLKVETERNGNIIFRVSNSQLKSAEERVKRNPEDVEKKDFITDLLD
ncbi:MAG: hypothetical protein M0P71_01590 [Melioribacteraceae bacterium]|nr:hypothetical protein [Melioribacteraceae bacterium]